MNEDRQRAIIMRVASDLIASAPAPPSSRAEDMDRNEYTSDDQDRVFFDYLRKIVEHIEELDPQANEAWNNDTFQTHKFCYGQGLDGAHCPWCHYPTSWGEPMRPDAADVGAEADCAGGVAPNFWHKRSGVKLWWYKSWKRLSGINVPSSLASLEALMQECLASLPSIIDADGDPPAQLR